MAAQCLWWNRPRRGGAIDVRVKEEEEKPHEPGAREVQVDKEENMEEEEEG